MGFHEKAEAIGYADGLASEEPDAYILRSEYVRAYWRGYLRSRASLEAVRRDRGDLEVPPWVNRGERGGEATDDV